MPKGKGKTGTYYVYIRVVTPYWLFNGFKKSGVSHKIFPIDKSRYTTEDPKKLIREFVPAMNDLDNIKW